MVKHATAKTSFGSLQNPDQVSSAVIFHSSFSPEGAYNYCIITPGADHYRLRVFDTATGNLKNDYEEKEGDGKWTCVRWGHITEVASKKRRNGSLSTGNRSPVLALGHTNGQISIYSLAHGLVLHQLSGSHTGKVNDFCFSASGTRGFSAGEDGLICEWDVTQGVEISKFHADNKSVKKIQLDHEENMLLTAGHNMKLWDLASREVIKSFTGHASAITNVDRFINLWDCTRDNQQEGNITALTLDNTVSHIDISPSNEVLAISEEGTAGLWQNAQTASGASNASGKVSKKKRYTTRACDCLIKIESSRGDRSVIPLLGGAFTPQGQMILARGSNIKPVFEKVEFQNEDGSLKEKEMVLTRTPVTGFLMDESAQTASNVKATKKSYDESAVTVVGAADFAMAQPGLAETVDENDQSDDGRDSESEEKDVNRLEGRTMEEKLKDLTVERTGRKAKHYPTPKANSLQQMLIQALHSNDLQLLEACLTYSNVEVIRNTVRRLPAAYVIPFLTQVIHKFQQKPSRGEALLEWIKAVLLIHTAYLMTVPDLIKKLSNFYQTLDSRVSVYQKLTNLNGRLDLLMSQVELTLSRDTNDTANEAETVYREDEDDDEDDEDMDLEDDLEDDSDASDDSDGDSDDDEDGSDSEMSDDDDEGDSASASEDSDEE
ncbi:WD repeat-containing protein 43 [Linnemannia exigua]|uniref:WD repeat-containing protein 43 n=1 Tax=Linnemannia exigua TaxID=604196 RepID=A0AAD4DL81_9FUNG|nr:WD repeat-containing protein 43 [Linnemannia exigua]